jgi:hypothetical protein
MLVARIRFRSNRLRAVSSDPDARSGMGLLANSGTCTGGESRFIGPFLAVLAPERQKLFGAGGLTGFDRVAKAAPDSYHHRDRLLAIAASDRLF